MTEAPAPRPEVPSEEGSLGSLVPGLRLPPAFPDLRSNTLARLFMGLLPVALLAILLGHLVSDRTEARYLVRHGVTGTGTVLRVWETGSGRSRSTHVAVAAFGGAVELAEYDGSPAVGEELGVVEDPRDGQVWQASRARGVAGRPLWVLVALGALVAAGLAGAAWLALYPLRLARRAGSAQDLHVVRGTVTGLRAVPGSRSSAPSWAVHVTDAAGHDWCATLARRGRAQIDEDVRSTEGSAVTLVLVGRRLSRSGGALLVPSAPLPSGRSARWCIGFPTVSQDRPVAGPATRASRVFARR